MVLRVFALLMKIRNFWQDYPGILRGVLYMIYYLVALSCNALVVPEYPGILRGVLYMIYYLLALSCNALVVPEYPGILRGVLYMLS